MRKTSPPAWGTSSVFLSRYDWYHIPQCHYSPVHLWPLAAGPRSGCRHLQGTPQALSSALSVVGSRRQPGGWEVVRMEGSTSSPWDSGCASARGSSGCPYDRHSPLCNYWRWKKRGFHKNCQTMKVTYKYWEGQIKDITPQDKIASLLSCNVSTFISYSPLNFPSVWPNILF